MQPFSRILGLGRRFGSFRHVPGFDPSWYSNAYPDVAGVIERGQARNPEDHYRRFGAAEGRNPNRFFSEKLYRRFYPDVEVAIGGGLFATAFEHFIHNGESEGRLSNPMPVDESWYCQEYPDVAESLDRGLFESASDHYRLEGCLQGKNPHAAFSESWYLQAYPDVAQSVQRGQYLCGYQHLLETGLDLGLRPHPQFDEADYRSRHPEIDAMIRRGEITSGYRHLIEEGLRQGRMWKQISDMDKLRRAAERLAGIRLDEFLASNRRIDLTHGSTPEVCVVLVLFNRAELTLQCLRSLVGVQDVDFELVIVDNCSTDRTGDVLARIDGIRVLANTENIGFTLAANQAAEAATAPYLLFVNNDAEILPSSLRVALDRIQSSGSIGAVGGRILRLDGFLQEAGCIVWNDGRTAAYGGGEDPESGAYLFPREVDYCSGVFLLAGTKAFRDLGGFDVRFAPAYYEDVDLCLRLQAQGLATVYEPDALVVHFGSASFETDPSFDLLVERNRKLLVDLHRETLKDAFVEQESNLVAAADRGAYAGRILWIDDRVPLPRFGAGSPRSREILRILSDLGYRVTVFCTAGERVDPVEIREQLPFAGVEFITESGIDGLVRFWKQRATGTDIVIISRPHNMMSAQALGLNFGGTTLIYDAEALISSRITRRRDVLGGDDARDKGIAREDELALASRADEVWAVSENEAGFFSESCRSVTVVGAALDVVDTDPAFDERSGILFVGRLQEAWSPNVDGLSWFLQEVYPLINESLGERVAMTVVGEVGAVGLPRPEGVGFVGAAEDVSEFYRTSRIFVAPARFSAGIPWKVGEAAANGLPVVASSDLVEQLGWLGGADILDGGCNDPVVFAERCCRLLGQRSLWQDVREGALNRIREENSKDRLRSAIESSIESIRKSREGTDD